MLQVLVTVTVFDGVARLVSSSVTACGAWSDLAFTMATAEGWAALLATVPEDAALRIGVVDRRPGTVATSRAPGVLLTGGR